MRKETIVHPDKVSLFSTKEMTYRVTTRHRERQSNGMGEIYIKHTSDEGLMFKIYMEFKQVNSKNTNNLADKGPEQLLLRKRHTTSPQVYEKKFQHHSSGLASDHYNEISSY
jgi:hypothetical protein